MTRVVYITDNLSTHIVAEKSTHRDAIGQPVWTSVGGQEQQEYINIAFAHKLFGGTDLYSGAFNKEEKSVQNS